MIRAFLLACVLALVLPGCSPRNGCVAAMGGSDSGDTPESFAVYQWIVDRAKEASGGRPPHVVILGAIPLEEPDSRIGVFTKAGAGKVTPLVIDQASSPNPAASEALLSAHAVLLRGGDQSRYVNWWAKTPVEDRIRGIFQRGGVVAGTSAGCAVLGEVVYDSNHGSLSPEEAMRDARHPDLTLTRGFLNLVPAVLFDTHFSQRGRLARLPVMLAHADEHANANPTLGVGVDEATAVCVDRHGRAQVIGEGAATLVRLLGAPQRLQAGMPPRVEALVRRIPAGNPIDLRWKGTVRAAAAEPRDTVENAWASTTLRDPAKRPAPPPTGTRLWVGSPPNEMAALEISASGLLRTLPKD